MSKRSLKGTLGRLARDIALFYIGINAALGVGEFVASHRTSKIKDQSHLERVVSRVSQEMGQNIPINAHLESHNVSRWDHTQEEGYSLFIGGNHANEYTVRKELSRLYNNAWATSLSAEPGPIDLAKYWLWEEMKVKSEALGISFRN